MCRARWASSSRNTESVRAEEREIPQLCRVTRLVSETALVTCCCFFRCLTASDIGASASCHYPGGLARSEQTAGLVTWAVSHLPSQQRAGLPPVWLPDGLGTSAVSGWQCGHASTPSASGWTRVAGAELAWTSLRVWDPLDRAVRSMRIPWPVGRTDGRISAVRRRGRSRLRRRRWRPGHVRRSPCPSTRRTSPCPS